MAEPLQVTRYAEGDRYEFHHDTDRRMARLLTFLAYINTPVSGGATIFPFAPGPNLDGSSLPMPLNIHNLDEGIAPIADYCLTDQFLRVSPQAGDAIVFYSMKPHLQIDEDAWHGACPVTAGTKLIVQRWIKVVPDPNYYSTDNSGEQQQ